MGGSLRRRAAVPSRGGGRRGALPRGRPVLLVANHFNGFVDPVLITSAMGRTPRFVAKAGLQRVPVAGWLLRRAGVVFVHRQVDAGGAVGNESAFRRVPPGPRRRGTWSRSSPRAPPTTAPAWIPSRPVPPASRSARGRRRRATSPSSRSASRFPDKVALRSSALVQFGPPIELDVVSPGARRRARHRGGAPPHRGDRRAGCATSAHDFPDVETALALEQAAQVALSSRAEPDPSLEARYELARRLGRGAPRGPARRAPGHRALPHGAERAAADGRRRDRADQPDAPAPVGPRDRRARRAARRRWWPPPPSSTCGRPRWSSLASLLVKTPVSKGTVRVLVGLVAFPAAWITAGVLTADGALRVTLVVLTAAVGALAAVWLVERAMAPGAHAAALAGPARADRHGRRGARPPGRGRRHRPSGRGARVSRVSPHVAASDCEEIRPGLIGQPANTLSSLAFVVAAVPIARAARRRGRPAWIGGGRRGRGGGRRERGVPRTRRAAVQAAPRRRAGRAGRHRRRGAGQRGRHRCGAGR